MDYVYIPNLEIVMNLEQAIYWANDNQNIVVISVFILLVLLVIRLRRPRYTKRSRILTKAETVMFKQLKPLESKGYILFAQVRIADVINVGGREGSGGWWKLFRKISSKHIDFVFVDRNSMEPIVAVELDDKSHDKPERVRRDKLINKIFKESGLPLVRYTTSELFNKQCNFKRLGL